MIILLPILLWPLVFFMTIFFFDDPGANPIMVWALFLGVNAYPIYLFVVYRFNLNVYEKWGGWGHLIPLAIVMFFAYLIISEMISSHQYKQELREREERRIQAGYLGNCKTYRLKNDSLFFGQIYFEADIFHFELLTCHYAKDSTFVYKEDKIIKQADPKTFEKIKRRWQKDKSNYFYKGQLIKGIDYSSFEILSERYAKDNKQVYYEGKIVEGARPSSFKINSITYIGHDGVNKFKYGKMLEE